MTPQLLFTGLTRGQAIAIRHDANIRGKHKHNLEHLDAFYAVMHECEYVCAVLPLERLDFISQDEGREKQYATTPGEFPPIYVRFSRWNKTDDNRAAVLDGNHRCCAAVLRSQTSVTAVLPSADFDRLCTTV
jgi:hypothetical protein